MSLGKLLITTGLFFILVGILVMAGSRLGLGKLPGDIIFRRGTTTFYFPLVTSILVSLLLTFMLNVFLRR